MPTSLQQARMRQSPEMFSVVMPVYNHADYIDAAIDSVRRQSRQDWRLIVVDDGSTDDSPAIADRHAREDSRISVIHQPNAGPAAARNAAIAQVRTPWLTFLDSDDLWYPDTLTGYATAIAEHPGGEFFYGYRDRLNADGSQTPAEGEFQDGETGTAELLGRMYLSTMVVCLAHSLVNRAGAFDESLSSCEDYEIFLRLSLLTRFQPIGYATGLRRRHGRNISVQSGFSRFQEAEVLRRFLDQQGGGSVVEPQAAAKRLAKLYYSSGRQYFRSLCARQARVALDESRKWAPSVKAAFLKALCIPLLLLRRDDGREMPRLSPPDQR